MHNLDVQQSKFHGLYPESNKWNWRKNQASFAGRTQQTGADYLPPFRCDDTKGPRLTKKQKGPHFDMPSKSGSNPSVSPYPPVRHEWEDA